MHLGGTFVSGPTAPTVRYDASRQQLGVVHALQSVHQCEPSVSMDAEFRQLDPTFPVYGGDGNGIVPDTSMLSAETPSLLREANDESAQRGLHYDKNALEEAEEDSEKNAETDLEEESEEDSDQDAAAVAE
ncbi:hypothetical protein MMPV_000840 [Pyropia vietnamensis]